MGRRKEQLGDHGYSLSPQDVSKEFWYYEEPKGLCCIYQPRAANGQLLFNAPAWYIPWKVLERTMKRRETVKRRARR